MSIRVWRESPRKQWVFTLNNYSDPEFRSIKAQLEASASYAIVGQEVAPSGTSHLQGYVSFKRKLRFAQVKDYIGDRAYVDVARGSPKKNREYCSKDNRFWEHGVLPGPCRSSAEVSKPLHDLAEKFIQCLKEGHGLQELMIEQPYYMLQYSATWMKSFNNINAFEVKHRGQVICFWLHGPTGTGKSTFAHDLWPNAYIKDPSSVWWDGYCQEKEVIFEDFGHTYPPITNLLHWLSPFKCRVQTKGGHTGLSATKFIITSNFQPEEVIQVQVDAFKRRVIVVPIEEGTQSILLRLLEFESSCNFNPEEPIAVNEQDWSDIESITTSLSVMAQPLD